MKSIEERISEIKRDERKALTDALCKYGTPEDGGYEICFESNMPCIAGYFNDEPADILVYAAHVDSKGSIKLLGTKNDDLMYDTEAIYVEDIFTGHLETITDEILNLVKY